MSDALKIPQDGARIRQIRDKLKISQGEFAALAGVTVRAQRNYEAGLRTPNINYLAALAAQGVDVGYILTGLESMIDEKADSAAFRYLSKHLGISSELSGDFSHLISLYRRGEIEHADLDTRLANTLAAYRVAVLDAGLLASILEAIEEFPPLPPKKRAGVASLLYRAFRSSGRVDLKAVKDAVDLAS